MSSRHHLFQPKGIILYSTHDFNVGAGDSKSGPDAYTVSPVLIDDPLAPALGFPSVTLLA